MRIIRPSHLWFHAALALILGGAFAVVGRQATPVGAWLGLLPVLVLARTALRRPLRRWRVARRPFPPEWRAWLEEHVPLFAFLDDGGRRRFERDVRFVLDEWTFEGVGGVEVTPVLPLGVAAGAAMLLHGRPDWELPARHTVLFYPGRFDEDYLEGDSAAYDGMAHAQGPVIISTEAFEADWAAPHRGHNVVLHELAHLLDYEDAFGNGTPAFVDPSSAEAWRKLVRREMQHAKIGRSLLRSYAGTNPAELFAVAVENFFGRPLLLRKRHPELFEALVAIFNLDPTPYDEASATDEEDVGEAGDVPSPRERGDRDTR